MHFKLKDLVEHLLIFLYDNQTDLTRFGTVTHHAYSYILLKSN